MPDYKIITDIRSRYEREVYQSLCIPSFAHSYSLAIQYMQSWFLSKFPDTFFKTVHIDGKHVLQDFRTMNRDTQLKRLKPSLAIIPEIDFTFDREKIDFYPYGINAYVSRSKFDDAFFKDRDKNTYMAIAMEANMINFTFRARFSTRAQQIDIFKFMRLAFKIKATEGDYVDMDFHIPYNLMVQLAIDAGFEIDEKKEISKETAKEEVVNKRIVDVIGLLGYLNQHSQYPFLYKYRCINGKDEFFMRVPELYIHLRIGDISVDNGEREGHISNNFMLEMPVELTIPAPMFYVYFSENKHTEFDYNGTIDTIIPVYTAKIVDVPKVNGQKWDQFLTTQYEEEDRDKPLVIEFRDLFRGSIGDTIEYNNSIYISSSIFIDIKLYNEGHEVEHTIDWPSQTLTTKQCMTDVISFISVYIDKEYMSEHMIEKDKMQTKRLQ